MERDWTIEKIHPETGEVEETLSLAGLDLNYNDLAIPARFMGFGLHRVSFKIKMDPVALDAAGAGHLPEIVSEVRDVERFYMFISLISS